MLTSTQSPNRRPALLSLAIGYFALGVSSLAVVGLGAPIGADLHVTPARVGLLVTVFAVTFAIAAPLAPEVVGRFDRKRTLLLGLGLLVVGGLLSAAAPDYGTLVATKVPAALGAAIFGPLSSASASLLVPPERRQAALAVVFGGMTVAAALGVPLTAFLSNAFGWRLALLLVAAMPLLAFVLVAWLVPPLPPGEHPSARDYLAVVRTPGVFAAVATTLLVMAAQFVVYAVIGTYLAARFDAGPTLVSAILLVFGSVGVVGNAVAGRVGGRLGGSRTVTITLIGLAVALAALVPVPRVVPAAMAVLAGWAFFGQLYQAPQQARLVTSRPDQRALVLAMNAAALYLGMSVGSLLGSTLLPVMGATWLPVVSLMLLALAGSTHLASARATEPATTPAPTTQQEKIA